MDGRPKADVAAPASRHPRAGSDAGSVMTEQRWLDGAGSTETTGGEPVPRSTFRRMVAAVFGIDLEERARRRHARGEQEVGQRLEHLPAEWHVLHELPIDDGANAEHLVVGPPGVFVVEPVVHGGRVTVTDRTVTHRGDTIHYMHKSLRKAHKLELAVAEVLGSRVEVKPVLAFVGARLDRRDHLDGVGVVRSRKLADWFTGHEERVLSPGDVTQVAAAASLVQSERAGTSTARGSDDRAATASRRHAGELPRQRTVA